MKHKQNIKAANLIVAFLASGFQAFGMYNIHAVSDITEGGVLGATLLLEHWLSLSPALTGALGRSFLIYSLAAAAGFSSGYWACEQFPPLYPQIAAFPLAAAVLGALFIGIGAGICIRAGGATTGDDALAMSLSRLLDVPIQRIYLISDLAVLLLSLSYIPFRKIAWSLLTVILSGQIIGWIQPRTKK